MKKEFNSGMIRDAINKGYGALEGNQDLADWIIQHHEQQPSSRFSTFRRKKLFPVVVFTICLLVATALALALMNKPVAPGKNGVWRYANGVLTYQGENDKKPQIVLEDEEIKFIAADTSSGELYYITRKDNSNWLLSINADGVSFSPGREIDSKYQIIDLQICDSFAYVLANTASAERQVICMPVFEDGLIQDAAIQAEGWENKTISTYAVYENVLYAFSAERNELATIDLTNWSLKWKPINTGDILSMTAGFDQENESWIVALIQSEATKQKRLTLINTATGEKQDTGEAVPDWAKYVSRDRYNVHLIGEEAGQERRFNVNTLSGKQVLYELFAVNVPSPEEPVMQAAVKMFHEKYPDVEIVFREIADERILATELMAGEGTIDIYGDLSNGGYLSGGLMLRNGVLRDLTDNPYIQENWKSWRDLRKLVSSDGRQYGVLYTLDLYTFCVSDEWAKKINWEIPQGDWSMDEFEDLVNMVITWNETHEEHLYLLCDYFPVYFMKQYEAAHTNACAGIVEFETEAYCHMLKLIKKMQENHLILWISDLWDSDMSLAADDASLPENTLLRVSTAGLSRMTDQTFILPPSPAGQTDPYIVQYWDLYVNANSRHPEEAEYLLACFSSLEATSQRYYLNEGLLLKDRSMYAEDDPQFAKYNPVPRKENETRYNDALEHALPYHIYGEIYRLQANELWPAFMGETITAEEYADAVQQQMEMLICE